MKRGELVRKGLFINSEEMVVTTSEGINFYLDSINPWTFPETYPLEYT